MASDFLFDSFSSKAPQTARKRHLKTLYDLMHVSILRQDLQRASAAWAILIRCPDFDTRRLWRIGLGFLLHQWGPDGTNGERPIDFLKTVMLQEKNNKHGVLTELVLLLIKMRKFHEALEELELYLPSFPYQENPVLHIYAGALHLFLAQVGPNQENNISAVSTNGQPFSIESFDESHIRVARDHFIRACDIDPDNSAGNYYLSLLDDEEKGTANLEEDREEENSYQAVSFQDQILPAPPRKRARI
ncbi:hypothetical protein FRC14_003560 [Serendipita sp. 396]|nr:hypothetical protein FRC14_003560 [Serendipita sp. 396]KAG8788226.1 hypothetical protein FRC15_005396 [Serendipita sp. 397]KAG8874368.1 hypothetical protein FRC20_006134 [Serendipita sp. 405]